MTDTALYFHLNVEWDSNRPYVEVVYRTEPGRSVYWATSFKVDKSNSEISSYTDTRTVLLPINIQGRILRYAFNSDECIRFDLQKRTVTGLDTVLLGLDRESRYHVLDTVKRFHKVALRMETSMSCTDFDGVAALQEWLASPFQWTIVQNRSSWSSLHDKDPHHPAAFEPCQIRSGWDAYQRPFLRRSHILP